MFEYIGLEPSIPEKGGTIIPYHSLMGEVEFRNVRFSYPTRPEQAVLDDFSLRIPPGKVRSAVVQDLLKTTTTTASDA